MCWCKLKNDRIRIRKSIVEFKNEMKINQEESTKLTDDIKELNIKINKNRLFN
jgi:predicted  nucleic acid-binding Zn-ribbon protein